jgi:hypothetical protein
MASQTNHRVRVSPITVRILHMFSLTSSNVTRAQLRNSSARLSRRASHSVKIIGAAAIALLAAGNNLANAADNPVRTAQEQHACAVVLSLDPSGPL